MDKTVKKAKKGITSLELNDYAHRLIVEAQAIPAALRYGSPPYPRSICISPNEVICHGIADERPFIEGDIANIDVAVILDGYYGDCSAMVTIGKTTEEKRHVVEVSRDCLLKAISVLKPGVLLSKIGNVIEEHARAEGCSVVTQFVGHGVGVGFHEAPQVLHYQNDLSIPLAEGMTFTIEPMINAGLPGAFIDKGDGWTARTVDGRPSAQWEHTLLITNDGYEILTA